MAGFVSAVAHRKKKSPQIKQLRFGGPQSSLAVTTDPTALTPDDPAVLACCAACRNQSGCRGWTIEKLKNDAAETTTSLTEASEASPLQLACKLAPQISTTFPSLSSYSGYPIKADAASWCGHVDDNSNNGEPSPTSSPTLPHENHEVDYHSYYYLLLVQLQYILFQLLMK